MKERRKECVKNKDKSVVPTGPKDFCDGLKCIWQLKLSSDAGNVGCSVIYFK